MDLHIFITSLLDTGEVTVKSTLEPFGEEELIAASDLLKAEYQKRKLEMPGEAPAFSAFAALWAAKFLYRSIQLTLLREHGNEIVEKELIEFPKLPDAEAIFSVDLVFCCLPGLLRFAKGLSPEDVLVKKLQKASFDWPFSSVGIELKEEPLSIAIIKHPSLKYAYIERIIDKKDHKRLLNPHLLEIAKELLGAHADTLWPQLKFKTSTIE